MSKVERVGCDIEVEAIKQISTNMFEGPPSFNFYIGYNAGLYTTIPLYYYTTILLNYYTTILLYYYTTIFHWMKKESANLTISSKENNVGEIIKSASCMSINPSSSCI